LQVLHGAVKGIYFNYKFAEHLKEQAGSRGTVLQYLSRIVFPLVEEKEEHL
jgi:hypothetical protein